MKIPMRLPPRPLLVFVLVFVSVLRATDATPIVATDLLKLKQLESPALSPDARWVAYVVRSIVPQPDTKDDWTYQSHLWLAATDGSTPPRPLTSGPANDTAPVWSPGGDCLAFVRSVEKEKPQLRILPLAGGESLALTKLETGATAPRWSPDGTKLLFTSSLTAAQVRDALEKARLDAKPRWSTEKPTRTANDTANHALKKKADATGNASATAEASAKADGTLAERREWLAKNEAEGNPRALHRLAFLDERDINPEQTFAHLFVQDARDGPEPRDLTPGYTSFAGGEWTADGKSVICSGPRNRDEHPDRSESTVLYRVDAIGTSAGSEAGVNVLLALKGYSTGNPQPSPDGQHVAFTATQGETLSFSQAAVGVVPASGGTARLLTEKLDRNAGNLEWAPDSASLCFVAPTGGGFPLYRVTIATGTTERLSPTLESGVRAYTQTRETLVQVLTTPANPSELYVSARDARTVKPLTMHNAAWLAGKPLSAYEAHTLTRDGRPVQYWTMKPLPFDAAKKYPLLLQIHGGPTAMWGPGEESMWFEFQYFAAQGYAIVFANPRGSGGYGYAFQRANYQDWGAGPAADILAATDAAAQQPFVDAQRQVITGGSYGGYMVAWIIGHDQRFKAAVAQRGVYDLLTFFGEGNAWRLVPHYFGGYPWQAETRRILERESPLTHVEAIKTPLLIQHGDNDRRTGFVQSEMLLRSLKVMGRDVEAVRYPRASHEMSRAGEPKQRLDSLVRYEEFFRRYLGAN